MNVLILGDGDEERAWALWLIARPEHRLDAAYPGFPTLRWPGTGASRPRGRAGPPRARRGRRGWSDRSRRGESLRRAAAEGFAHHRPPPARPDSEAYYQVALSREETGAADRPDLPLRLHPGVKALGQALSSRELGSFRGLRLEAPASAPGGTWSGSDFARAVDVVRAIVGEIDALTATGDPPGEDPDVELVVHLRGAGHFGPKSESGRTLRPGAAHIDGIDRLAQPGDRPDRSRRHACGTRAATRRSRSNSRLGTRGSHPRGARLFDGSTRRQRTARAEPARRHPRDGAVRGGQSQPAPRTDGRDALRVDQRGCDVQVDHDVNRLPGLLRLTPGLTYRNGRAAARHEMDALHPLPDPAGVVLFVVLQTLRLAIRRPRNTGTATKRSGDQ